MNPTLRKYLTIFALSLAGGSIYTLPYIKYVFYDTQMEVMGITNTQSGFLLSMYAIGCIVSYIPGGLITDKISPRKAIAWSLFGTAILGFLYGVTFSYTISLVIWFLFALTTAFVFWTSLMKAIGMAGDSEEQARLYGIYYAGTAIGIASIIGYTPDFFFSAMFGSWLDSYGNEKGYAMIFIFLTIVAAVGAVMSFAVDKRNARKGYDAVAEAA